MNDIAELFSNYVLNVAVVSWLCAQIIKTVIILIKTKKFNPERLFGAGGMPSAHSASVCGTTIALAKSVGFSSPIFAISFLLATIVMYDAMGVRRAAGEHARVINMIVKKAKEDNPSSTKSYTPKSKDGLKEFLGHTPLQVMGGALLGILIAMIMPM
ncbi:MAG: divergent PAP2 family protein [Oscillospiraceae bacterium]